ncbi:MULTISPECIES: hypothetical protein [Lactobacillales]|jgi:uncharacterized membrane protein YfcA|uniref:DUF2178 domain-containing protein n=1 Tax=Carnobacterium viridans TaxID=174587 RepID=A0A1H0XI37_9LACT|nr:MULTISPECIES: hypothetical protein [Lactobacillales]RXS50076.1 hypothetical protein ES032_13670 [Lactococcus lactis]TBX31425.1 hypothetical protein EUZ95_08510 [Enterococcus durans]UDE96458.1 hypothetical protein LHA31_12465 [Carnobacterium viridans]SDQ02612.1 hypothetical protein SAMN04487752_0127 [Carnobacterium viridans]
MSIKDREVSVQQLTKWVPYYLITCTFLGAVLGSFLIYYFQGEFPYEVLTAGLVATLFLTVIEVIKQKKKKNNIPDADERVIKNISRFFAYTSHILTSILFISLGVFTLLGKESISIFYLWILFFSYIWIVGIGALIIKRK